MSVLAEAISVIVPIDIIERKYPGGLEQYRRNCPNDTFCADEHLTRVGFMSPADVRRFVTQLELLGLRHLSNGRAVDIVVIDQIQGPTSECGWIEGGRHPQGYSAVWRADTIPGWLAYPVGWTPQQSARLEWARNDSVGQRFIAVARERGIDALLDFTTGKEVYVGRVLPPHEAIANSAQVGPSNATERGPQYQTATQLLKQGNYAAALTHFRALCEAHPNDWYAWYGAGQAARFLNDFKTAASHLRRSAELDPGQAPTLLALGIALQLDNDLPSAVHALAEAIRLDPDHPAAYNSLAVTQRKLGQFDKALHNCDAGQKALARRLVKRIKNSAGNRIIKLGAPVGTRWIDCAMYGALWLASETSIASVAWPTGESAVDEEGTEKHKGLYYIDQKARADFVRLYLPNYFGSFRQWLRDSGIFTHLVASEGVTLEQMGDALTAQERFREAKDFGDPTKSSITWSANG